MAAGNTTNFTNLGFVTSATDDRVKYNNIGTATLVAGTVSVSNTNLTANDLVFVTRTVAGGTEGYLTTAVTPGTGFTITSSSNLDTSTVGYVIIRIN